MLRTNRLCLALCVAGMYFNFKRPVMVLERPVVPQQVTGLPEVECVWDHAE
ncbi:hypothetical protein [Acinetobacter thermotolerans]|uniref:hypothetical protein n=1 Tax=Acinetobacter thermotolerans TaxID=3151487 RepID=UPI00325BF2A1